MPFEIDAQTIQDLRIFDDNNPSRESIFSYFNKTKTFGGKLELEKMMQYPLDDLSALRERQEIIRFFKEHPFSLALSSAQMDFIDHYFRLNKAPLKANALESFLTKYWVRQSERNDLYLIQTRVTNLVYLLLELEKWLSEVIPKASTPTLQAVLAVFEEYCNLPEIKRMLSTVTRKPQKIPAHLYDGLFRSKYKRETEELMGLIYHIDAYHAVAETAAIQGLGFPEYVESSLPEVDIEGMFHPLLKNPVPNDWAVKENKNLCFLTGPNMAGKSTFLKSLGLSLYLAHLGFPVPARSMRTTIYHGLVTTINLSDHIDKGYSHFYAEVHRIKEVAQMIGSKKRVFVIFDELFRGTNVKDAYDASLLVIEAFAQIQQCTFCISTHITEVAEKLQHKSTMLFKFFEVDIVGTTPNYKYQLQDGVSHERLGMLILKNEGILEHLAASRQSLP
ncbi:MAG TPA: hypothetical protein VK014_08585 [Cyclobacteriaceae bacterium]|nr:hypothetical protein [Cyclobacteriaceae bacterium]